MTEINILVHEAEDALDTVAFGRSLKSPVIKTKEDKAYIMEYLSRFPNDDYKNGFRFKGNRSDISERTFNNVKMEFKLFGPKTTQPQPVAIPQPIQQPINKIVGKLPEVAKPVDFFKPVSISQPLKENPVMSAPMAKRAGKAPSPTSVAASEILTKLHKEGESLPTFSKFVSDYPKVKISASVYNAVKYRITKMWGSKPKTKMGQPSPVVIPGKMIQIIHTIPGPIDPKLYSLLKQELVEFGRKLISAQDNFTFRRMLDPVDCIEICLEKHS